ncbi:hypothetical protein LWI28_010449 [Acer negundo]|uniref:Uncharacterized protein n=1 Tax=Acer negundo TaxID=4023 RepID=A0AAD5IYG2_ACENE|nr:hypothetical protein LWI28_010449 [Acer negundo]
MPIAFGIPMHFTPSTTEVVIALIWRAQINAARARYGFLRTSLLSVTINLTGKTFKKVPENCCGSINTSGIARFEAANDEKTKMMRLNDFVEKVRDAIRNTVAEFGEPNEDEDGLFFRLIMRSCIDLAEQVEKGVGDVIPSRGIDIGPDLTDKEISKEESNLGGETHQAVKDDGLYIFKGEPSDSKSMDYKERDGGGSSNMGGLGTKLSADSSKRLLVRKIRSAEIRKFGGKFTNVLGKRSGDSRIVGEVYVLKKRKVIAKKGVITGVNQGLIQG